MPPVRLLRLLGILAGALAGSLPAVSTVVAQESESGRIIGRVVEASQGAPIAGAQLEVVGTTLRVITAVDGRFILADIPAGPVRLQVRQIGYRPKTVTGIELKPGESLEQNIGLEASVVELAEVTVSAEAERGSVARALDEQRNAVEIVNSITREQIAKSPDADAAQAAQRVPGVTVQDGKYIYVRGLGERYTQASLNGARIPSPEPEKKVVPLDLFPAALIEGITTSKTYTPDRPGDYSGAEVNIKTREFPSRRQLTITSGTSLNTRVAGKPSAFAPSTSRDWLAAGAAPRALPASVAAVGNLQGAMSAAQTNGIINSFRNVWSARLRDGAPSGGLGLSLGGTDRIFGHGVGYLISGSYSYAQEVRADEVRALAIAGADGSPAEINRFAGQSGRTTVLWGGVANFATNLGSHTKLSWNNTYSRTMDNDGRDELGVTEDLGPLQVQRLRYVERNVLSTRLSALHSLGRRHFVEWAGDYSNVMRKEPDRSEIVYSASLDPNTGRPISTAWYGFSNQAAVRTFADLSEHASSGQLSYQLLLGPLTNPWSLKVGGFYRHVSRDADNTAYSMSLASSLPASALELPPEQLFDGRFTSGSQSMFRVTTLGQGGSYTARDRLGAGFAMLAIPFGRQFEITAGARYEDSRVTVDAVSTTGVATRSQPAFQDWLPALLVTYRLTSSHNLRLGVSRTLSRPEYRELAPLLFREVIGADNVLGNPALRRARIDNVDLRWEWYPSGSEIISLGVFYKRFHEPIERVYLATSGTRIITFANATGANNYGIEAELRKNLRTIAPALLPFTFFTNVTAMRSRIDITNSAAAITNPQRRMVGQAPYVVNAGLTYSSGSGAWSATALYNIVGERITEAGEAPLPDVIEQPRNVLDLSLRFPVAPTLTGRVDAKNLFDAPFRFEQGPVTRESYRVGRTFGIGFSWQP